MLAGRRHLRVADLGADRQVDEPAQVVGDRLEARLDLVDLGVGEVRVVEEPAVRLGAHDAATSPSVPRSRIAAHERFTIAANIASPRSVRVP